MDWYLIEESDREHLYSAKVSGGILVKYSVSFGATWTEHVTYVHGARLRKNKDGTSIIVKGK